MLLGITKVPNFDCSTKSGKIGIFFVHFDKRDIHLSARNSFVMLVSGANECLSPALNPEKERSLKLKRPVNEPGCRQVTSKVSLHHESNEDECLNGFYQARKALQIGVFLIFLSEFFLQRRLPLEGVKVQPGRSGWQNELARRCFAG